MLRLVLTILWISMSAALLAQDERSLVPTEAERTKAAAAVREVFKSDYDKAKSPAQRIELSRKIIADSEKTQNSAERYAMLESAREIAAKAGGAAAGFRAVDLIENYFQTNVAPLREGVYLDAIKLPAAAEDSEALLSATPTVLRGAMERDEYKSAEQIAQGALAAAKRIKSQSLIVQAAAAARNVEATARVFERVKPALKTLETEPTNAEANLTVGKFQALYKGDWGRGGPLLALGSDSALREPAARELSDTVDPQSLVALGDAWWDVGEKLQGTEHDALRLRAGTWYEAGYRDLPEGLAKTKVGKRLEEILELGRQLPPPPLADVPRGGAIKPGSWVNVLEWSDLSDDKRKKQGWIQTGEEARCPAGKGHRYFQAPATTNGGYDLVVVYAAPTKGSLILILPVASKQSFNVDMHQEWHALESIDGKRVSQNGSAVKMTTPISPKLHRLYLSVRMDGQTATIDSLFDGKPVIHWKGKSSRLNGWGDRPAGLQFGTWNAELVIQEARFRPISGTASRGK